MLSAALHTDPTQGPLLSLLLCFGHSLTASHFSYMVVPKTAHNIQGGAASVQIRTEQSPPRCSSGVILFIGLGGHPPLEKESSLKLDVFNIRKVP